MSDRGTVGIVARVLGYAGLLPQLVAVCLIALHGPMGRMLWPVSGIAIVYPAVILSFLGGLWWTMAMRRTAGQGALAVLAVLPSLVALMLVTVSTIPGLTGWATATLGIAILLTLPVDRRLANTGEAPVGWMALRVPLSLGLGALTIAAGVLIAGPGPDARRYHDTHPIHANPGDGSSPFAIEGGPADPDRVIGLHES